MDTRIKELVDFTKEKLGLDNYNLFSYSLYRSINTFNETEYTLSMEYFPNHIINRKDDLNPVGTACVDLDIHNKHFKSVIFVGGKSFANGIVFGNHNEIITWIEREFGLKYREQFMLSEEVEGKITFVECIDTVSVYLGGFIEVQYDAKGNLTFFSMTGQFSKKEFVKEEKFSANTPHNLIKDQLKLIEYPLKNKSKFIFVYVLENVMLSSNQSIFSLESLKTMDKIMHWDEPINEQFNRKEIFQEENITPEQAFASMPHPDLTPITELEQDKCILAVQIFLQQVYPNDSGKWKLQLIHRNKGHIHALLKLKEENDCAIGRKLLVIVDATNYKAINYMDNKPMLEMFAAFEKSDEIKLTKEKAYEKIKDFIEITPIYIYDDKQKCFILRQKVSCPYVVNACTGDLILLKHL